MCPVSVFHNYQLLFQLLQEKHFSSCTCKVQSIQLLLQLWIHNNYFQNFPTKLVLQIALVFVTLYSDTLLAPTYVHSLWFLTQIYRPVFPWMPIKQLYFDSPYKLSKEAKSLRRAYDPNPLLICRVFELSYWLCPVI